LAGFIFALHPVCVESVAWISEQKNTLSAVFYLASALVYLKFDRDRRPQRYWVALGLFVLALLSKTVTATLPAALLVVFWWSRGRLSWARDARPLLPWIALGGTAGLFSAWVERALIGAHGAVFSLTALERCLLAGRVIWFYLGKLVWPADLAFIYPRWVVDSGAWWQYSYPSGVLAVLVGLGLLARLYRGPLAGFLIFAGTLFPVLGFINVYPFVFSYVADHFQYLASLGIIVPVAAGLTLAARRFPPGARQLVPVGGGLLVAALGVLTWRQAGVYRDAQTLYRETLALNPACPMAHNNLGLVLSQIPGRLPEAISHYEAALRSDPRNLEAHLNLGYALARIPGRLAEAIKVDEEAVRIDPGRAEAHDNLAVALSQVPGRMPEAVAEFEAAVRLNPDSAEMQDHLGTALMSDPQRWPEAIDHLERAVQISPGSAAIRDHLGVALAKAPARMPEALAQFEEALRIDPGSAEAHDSIGKILMGIPGRLPEAIAHLEAAVRLDPGSADRHGALGTALLKDPGRLPEAIAQFEAVVRINPGLADGHFVLGVLLSSQPDRRQEALAHFETALKIRPDFAAAREWVERLRATPAN
jgi:tetratricopeptide (TPR) repeat protein